MVAIVLGWLIRDGVDTYSLLVNDLHNSGKVLVVDQDNTAQLNQSPVSSFNGRRHRNIMWLSELS